MPVYAVNKKAHFDYEILETLEAGIVLEGHEVKSLRTGSAKLTGAYVTFHKNRPMLTNFHIPKYRFAGNVQEYDPERSREILLKGKQIDYLRGKSEEKGLTIVPLSVYTKGRYIKVEVGIAKGKKTYDKRRVMKEREQKRETGRIMKGIYD
ncbi:MAG: SsrA-binding protein SmpB [Candidatus Magasanikbacteria bacterium]